VADLERQFRASYLLSGPTPEEIFDVRPGILLEFTLSVAGLTHQVLSTVTAVDFPLRLEWREGAVGSGGWLIA
jgi:hypothetical protein